MTNEIKDLCIRFFEGRTDESEDMIVMDFRASDTRTFHEWEKEWEAGASKNFEKCFGFENGVYVAVWSRGGPQELPHLPLALSLP